MGDSILNSVVACIIGLFLLFVGPIYSAYESTDKINDTMAQNALSSFQKNVRKNGYIDTKMYIKFLNELNVTGKVYTITMVHTSNLVYPSSENEGDYELHEIEYGTDNILETIKDGSTKYSMKYGDDFKLTIKEREVSPSRALLNIITDKNKASLLTFSGGGMVENEVAE